jgi:hypothetical protein
MGRTREEKMTRGALLFAFNSPKYNYYEMAEFAAKRINHFLGLPVTIVTDEKSIPENPTYKFDNTIIVEPDKNNIRDHVVWINKGRYQAYTLSPYDETLLLDTDYIVNSDKLLATFDSAEDFCCHDTTNFLMYPKAPQEVLSAYSFKTLWATVIMFKKTNRAKQIFDCLEMVQKNYEHYANIHSFIAGVYRNDYALTLALRIANGHLNYDDDIIPWNLVHVGKNTSVYPNGTDEFSTEYTVMYDNWQRGKIRKEFITVKDMDFHVMNKDNFLELMKNG